MGKVLVTGANGHLGGEVVRQLVAAGREVRGMVRDPRDDRWKGGLDVETAPGDLMDRGSLELAASHCEVIYHCAAVYASWARDPVKEIIQPTVLGSRGIIRAAANKGIKRVVFVSTAGTLGEGPDPKIIRDETSKPDEATRKMSYVKAKIDAEDQSRELAGKLGVDVVWALPTLIMGPGFRRPTPSVEMVKNFLDPGMPASYEGGWSVVDVADVARGLLLMEQQGVAGERYALAGDNVEMKTILAELARMTGLPAPTRVISRQMLVPASKLLGWGAWLTGKAPMIDPGFAEEYVERYAYVSAAKAERELGYTHRPWQETLARTVTWLLDNGFVSEARKKLITRPELVASR